MTSYQQRKKEIRELESQIFQLEEKLNEHGIEFGQLTIDDKCKDMEIPMHRNPQKAPPARTIKGPIACPDNMPPIPKVDCLSGNYPRPTVKDFFEGFLKNTLLSKFWKWLKYWFSPMDPSPKVSGAFHESVKRYHEMKEKPGIIDQNKHFGFYREKQTERFNEAMTSEEMINGEKVLVFIDRKALRKLIHGKKRYSISTPMVRAWK